MRVVLAVLAHEMTVAEAARRHGVSAESIKRRRTRRGDRSLSRQPRRTAPSRDDRTPRQAYLDT